MIEAVRGLELPTCCMTQVNQETFMTLKMQAAVVEQFGKPLLLRERDVPVDKDHGLAGGHGRNFVVENLAE